jgi:Carboxypeptidase regulatory-like domain
MRTEVATSHLRVTPGIPAILEVEVTNTADVIDGVTANIQGLDPSWVSLVVPVVSLFPDSTSTISLRIDLPKNCLAGEYLVSVHVASIIDADRFSDHEFWLSVAPVAAASLTMHPSVVVGGSSAVFQAAIANEGNITTDLVVNALDETRILTCIANPATVSVPPGETHFVDVDVSGPRKWFAQPVTRNITIDVTGPEIELQAKAAFTQKPRIPRGVLTALILASIVALWATVFLLVVSALRDQPDPTKATATDFNDPTGQQVDLAAVAATIGGAVTAESTGAPVPRITVEAMRLLADGSPDAAGSTATDDDGAYTLESLLPGSYKLRFSGEGFNEVWYPAAADAGSAGVVDIKPKAEAKGYNIVLQGMAGSFSGKIVAPESAGSAAAITVTIIQVQEQAAENAPPPPSYSPPVDAEGNFSQPIPVTPADYQFVIESTGFDPRQFTETLGPGENKVINTVTLGAAEGSISGFVTDGAGAPLGGVEITIRSGDFEKTTKTPTSGNVGNYRLDGLETPRAYVLTFTLPGFADQTVSLDLPSGQNLTKNVQLLGGTGTVTGTVTDKNGALLGGVTVAIARGTFTAETSTLTSASAVGQLGSYSVSALPTPGSYTFTFSLAGYESQTVRVDLPPAGSLAGVNVVLPKSTGDVSGVVTANGAPVADVIVELSDGSTPRTTASATAPAGAFRFADVPPGSYTLTFRRTGLVTRVVIIEVIADQTTDRNVDMQLAQ